MKPASRPELSTGLQIAFRKRMTWTSKPYWIKNAPYTVGPYAHDGQLEVRIRFGEIASKAKGKKGLAPDGLPWAAHFIKQAHPEGLKGYKAPVSYTHLTLPTTERV